MIKSKLIAVACLAALAASCSNDNAVAADNNVTATPAETGLNPELQAAAIAGDLVDMCIKMGKNQDGIAKRMTANGATAVGTAETGPMWSYKLGGLDTMLVLGKGPPTDSCSMVVSGGTVDTVIASVQQKTEATLLKDEIVNGKRQRGYSVVDGENRYLLAATDGPAGEQNAFTVGVL